MATQNWDLTKNRFSISDILRKVRGVNYLSKFYFEIEGGADDFLKDLLFDSSTQSQLPASNMLELRDLFFYSKGISIPSRGINTDTYTYSNGFKIEIPTGTNYGDGNINIPIQSDDKYTLYDFFIKWMDRIHSKETGFFRFHDDYTTNLHIKQLDYKTTDETTESLSKFHNEMSDVFNSTKFVYGIKLINCYPKAVSVIDFSHDNKEKVEFNVNMSYEGLNYLAPVDNIKSIPS